jgi:formamidopyrimidine-DNA glycosylase
MPELPEVETVRRALAMEIPGRRITAVRGQRVQMRRPLDPEALEAVLHGRYFHEPRRRGKYLLLDLEGRGSLLNHLGMSGRLTINRPGDPMLPHTHLVLELDNRRELRFVDPRRFGLMVWLGPGEEGHDPSLARLGMEPFDPRLERALPALFRARRSPVKSLLLDQRLVAGIGNIYAVESLWRAGIRPTRPGNRTSTERLTNLATKVRSVLREAIDQGGTTLRDFAGPEGNFGYFAVHLEAYGREGRPCRRCGGALRADVIAGRTTAWCGRCQR